MAKKTEKTLVTASGAEVHIEFCGGAWQCTDGHTWEETSGGEWRCQNIVDMNQAGEWEDGVEREAHATEAKPARSPRARKAALPARPSEPPPRAQASGGFAA